MKLKNQLGRRNLNNSVLHAWRKERNVREVFTGRAMNESRLTLETFPPKCSIYIMLGGTLLPSATEVKALLIFFAVISIVAFPVTAALNVLVIMALKTNSRMRANKSYILLASLATTDLMVGVIVQPLFTALLITIVQGQTTTKACTLQNVTQSLTNVLCDTSLIHLALISGERYLAMKHTFSYNTGLVTEARLLTCSALAWLFSLILHIPLIIDSKVFLITNNIFIVLSLAIIIFCQITVYCEVRRHEKQLSTQQVTEEARQKFLKDKKAFRLTSMIVSTLFICYLPVCVFRVILLNFRSIMSIQTMYACFFTAVWVAILNSFLNPIIYSFRMRQFRVAFVDFRCGTANIAEAEEIEMRVFRSHNAVGQAGQRREGAQENGEHGSVVNTNGGNNEILPQNESHIEQLSDNSIIKPVHRCHSIQTEQ